MSKFQHQFRSKVPVFGFPKLPKTPKSDFLAKKSRFWSKFSAHFGPSEVKMLPDSEVDEKTELGFFRKSIGGQSLRTSQFLGSPDTLWEVVWSKNGPKKEPLNPLIIPPKRPFYKAFLKGFLACAKRRFLTLLDHLVWRGSDRSVYGSNIDTKCSF